MLRPECGATGGKRKAKRRASGGSETERTQAAEQMMFDSLDVKRAAMIECSLPLVLQFAGPFAVFANEISREGQWLSSSCGPIHNS